LIGGALELSANSTYKDLDTSVAKCNTAAQGCEVDKNPNLVDMRKSGDSKRTLGYVGYGVAGAAIATGALLAFLNRRTPYQITPDILEGEKDKPPAVSFTPIVSPEMTGALVQGHF